jgi:hypothetical protein
MIAFTWYQFSPSHFKQNAIMLKSLLQLKFKSRQKNLNLYDVQLIRTI